MKTLIEKAETEEAFRKASDHRGAFPTGRVCDWGYQEWAEHCRIEGSPAKIYYLFSEEEAQQEESELGWDEHHISIIEIAEREEDGEFEDL